MRCREIATGLLWCSSVLAWCFMVCFTVGLALGLLWYWCIPQCLLCLLWMPLGSLWDCCRVAATLLQSWKWVQLRLRVPGQAPYPHNGVLYGRKYFHAFLQPVESLQPGQRLTAHSYCRTKQEAFWHKYQQSMWSVACGITFTKYWHFQYFLFGSICWIHGRALGSVENGAAIWKLLKCIWDICSMHLGELSHLSMFFSGSMERVCEEIFFSFVMPSGAQGERLGVQNVSKQDSEIEGIFGSLCRWSPEGSKFAVLRLNSKYRKESRPRRARPVDSSIYIYIYMFSLIYA